MNEIIRHFTDLNFTVVATQSHEYSIEFKVYAIDGYENGEIPVYSKPEGYGYVEADGLHDAPVFLSGHVKWDGCSNWRFDKQDEVMLHFCSREQLEAIGKLMAACWDMTAELCQKWMP